MNNPLLQIKNLRVDFTTDGQTSTAIENINIEVKRGEVLAVVGESGSGKSVTSLSILQLIATPPAKYVTGEILYTDKAGEQFDILHAGTSHLQKIRGNEIAMIFQEPMSSLNPVHTCGEQVMEAIMLHQNTGRTEAKKQTIELFEKVQLPSPSLIFSRYPHQLSGGQKQRVMIAMAMSCSPALLICDEPTTALDVTVQKTILLLIKELQIQLNMGVIFITHDLSVVAEVADRVVVMYKGKIVEQGSAREIYTTPAHPYTKALLACRPLLHDKNERLPVVSDFMQTGIDGEIQEKTAALVTHKNSYVNSTSTPRIDIQDATSNDNEVILSVENLKVWFAANKPMFGKPKNYTKAVDDVSFEVFKGETLGLVGESGCGKTTLGRAILRLIEPTAGSILFKNQNLITAGKHALRDLRKDMQIIFQDPYSSLNPRVTVGAAIAEPLLVHNIGNSSKQRKQIVIDLLEKVSLKPDHFYRYPHEFSGGQRQRIVIARALALNPSFIICDESVSALDVSVQAQVLNLLNDLKKEFEFTAIFISHDLSVVRYISDRIMVMNKGRIEETGDAESIYHHPQSPYTQKLIASIPRGIVV